jgi:pyruvate/2-oxoglutarate dehydrogenase complex dihydrolipoamide acyltransferase (E2) component
MSARTTRVQVAGWVRQAIADQPEVSLPDLADAAMVHFGDDPAFLQAFFREHVREMVYTLAQQVVGSSRSTRLRFESLQPVVTTDAAEQGGQPRPVEVRAKTCWPTWFEHAGSRHVRLFDMQRGDLLAAAEERERRGQTELQLAGLWRKLASNLPEGKSVGEVYTEESIDRWARLLKVQFKVTIPPPATLLQTADAAAD